MQLIFHDALFIRILFDFILSSGSSACHLIVVYVVNPVDLLRTVCAVLLF